MTKNDLFDLVQRVAAHWPHSAGHLTNDTTIAVWWATLKDVGRDEALAAVESLCREGRDHAPSDGLVLKRAAELGSDAPSWADVKAMLKPSKADVECGLCHGATFVLDDESGDAVPCSCRAGVVEARKARHPMVKAFLEVVPRSEAMEMFTAPKAGERLTAEAQTRTKWEQFVAAETHDRTLEGLPSGGLRRLERVNAAPKAFGELVEGK